MPNSISKDKIDNFLARNTVAVSVSALPADSLACPICNTPYSERDPSYVHPWIDSDAAEYPVQIIRCEGCNHIFGRHCLEHSIRAAQPWSHVCPVCRTAWFVPPHATRTEILAGVRRALDLVVATEEVGVQTGARRDLDEVERLLVDIEEKLLERRWI